MKKNISIIITKLNGGGAERCASNLSIELSKKYNVFLIVFDASDITYPHAGTLIDLKIPKAQNVLARYWGVIKRSWHIWKLKKQYNIDASISLMDGPNLVNVLSKWNEKTIVSVRNNLSKQACGWITRAIIKFTSRRADLTVSLSKMVEKDLVDNFSIDPLKVTTIYNHVDRDLLELQTSDSDLKLDLSKKYVVTMGRMHHQKGQWHLIKAFSKVSKSCQNLNLLILGTGPLKDKLSKLVDELGLNDRVVMPGYITSPHSYLKECEMFVLSSLYEGLGNVLLEAESFGLPIISTDCQSGPREILAPNSDLNKMADNIEFAEYGILVPVDESFDYSNSPITDKEEKLAHAIIKLHCDEKLREKYISASTKGASRFSKEKIIQDWVSIIED